MPSNRLDRINEELKRALAEVIHNDIKNPGISPMTSVLRVEATNDLKFAKTYISVMGSDKERQATMEALKSAKGFIKHQLSRRMTIRRIPELLLRLDDSIEYGIHIEQLIREIDTGDVNGQAD